MSLRDWGGKPAELLREAAPRWRIDAPKTKPKQHEYPRERLQGGQKKKKKKNQGIRTEASGPCV